jgi:AcrB/AcrD/AcrF family
MISDFFIARPVLANVLAILMMVVGGVAIFALPVAQYPDVVPPTVQVTTLSRRKCPHRHRYRRLANRAAGERRRGHDVGHRHKARAIGLTISGRVRCAGHTSAMAKSRPGVEERRVGALNS